MAKKSFEEVWADTSYNNKKSFEEVWGSPLITEQNAQREIRKVSPFSNVKKEPSNTAVEQVEEKKPFGLGYIGEQGWKGGVDTLANILSGGSNLVDNLGNTLDYAVDSVSRFVKPVKDIKDIYEGINLLTQGGVDKAKSKLNEVEVLDAVAEAGRDTANKMSNYAAKSAYDTENMNAIQKFAGNVARAGGGMVPSIAVGAVAGPTAGMATMASSAFGGSLQQALDDGAKYEDAMNYAIASAGVEVATEKLFGGMPFLGKGTLDDIAKQWIQTKISSNTGQAVINYLRESFGEGAEEYISEVVGEFLTDLYTGAKNEEDIVDRFINVLDDAFYSFLLGSATGGVMNVPGLVGDLKAGPQAKPETTTQESTEQKINNIIEQNQPVIEQKKVETDPMKAMINENAKAEAQKIVEKPSETEFDNNFLEKGLKSDNVAVKMEAQRINADNIRKSAKKANINQQIEEIIQVSNKLGKTVEFTEDLVDQKAWGANTGSKIVLSKKSGDMIQQIFVHELTHDAENSQLYSELETELSNLAAVNGVDITALTEQIIRDYAEQGVSLDDVGARAEVNARIAQEYLFKESGIKQLANTNLSLAQKVFNWVRSLRIKLSGTEAEKQLLKTEQLYKKAISETSKTSKTQYSIENAEFREENGVVIFNGNNFRNVINNSERSLSSELRTYLKRKYSGKYIYVGKLYDAYFNGTSATEYSYPANRNKQADFPYMENKANIAVDLNKLVENARFIGNDPDDGRHERAIGGWDNFKVTFGVERDGNVDYFEGVIKVMITDRGPLFYDITKIKRSRGLQGSNAPSSTSNNSIFDSSENNNTKYSISTKPLTEKQKSYFRNSKVVDENGDLLPVYHASPNAEFYVFDKQKASPESDMGAGFYFSNQETDAESNYSDETGPDIKNKIDRLAEQLEFEDGFEDADYDERYEEAKRRIVTGKTKHEVYLNIKNPVYVGDNQTMLFTYDHLQEYADDFNDGEVYDGIEDDFVYNLTEDFYDILDDSGIQTVNGIVYDALLDGGIDMQSLKENLNNAYLEDDEGNFIGNEVARRLAESLGYDGIIDTTVSKKFKGMNLDPDTVHYIAFKPNQIKQVTNESPTTSEDIRYSTGKSILEKAKDPAVRARAQMEKRIRHTFLFNNKSNPLKMYDVTSRIEEEFERTGKISEDLRKELFATAYEETLRSSDVSYKDLPEFKQMLQEDLNRAVLQYENTLIKERELKKFAEENDIDASQIKFNPATGFLKNVKPEELPDKIISYKKLKASLKSDLIGQVNNYAGGKVIDELIDKAAIEIVEDGFISSPTKFKIRQEMIENGYSINADAMNDNKELYDFIKSTKFNVPRGVGREIQDYERTKKLLKTSTMEGQPIDTVYKELRSKFGEFFPDGLTNQADQYQQIYDVMADLEPVRLMLEDSDQYNADMRQYLEDNFTGRLEDFKNQILYRSQKDYYDRAAKKQVAYDEAMNQVSEKISEKFFKDNQEIDELKKSEHTIKGASIEAFSEVVAKIKDWGNPAKTLSQNLDVMANGDVVLRAKLSEIFEKPLRKAKRTYVTNQKRVLNDVYKRIVTDLGIKMGSKESAAMMWYGEGKRQLNKVKGKVESDKLEFTPYTLEDLKKDFPKTWENIVAADKIMREYYDDYVDRINESLQKVYAESVLKESVNERRTQIQKDIREAQERLEQLKAQRTGEVGGPDLEARINAQRKRITDLSRQFNNVAEDVYRNKRLKKRSDYYHHFQEVGFAESIQQLLNVDNANNISNALAGISEFTKPKSKWEKFMQRRSDVARYEEDAIKGFLKYAPAAEYKISFDPYVAQLRGTIQDMIKLSDEANLNNAMSILWLTNYTNSLAGKTNPFDRWIVNIPKGRDFLRGLIALNSRVKGNAVVGNLNSAVSQFYNLPNGLAVLTDNGGVQASLDVAKGSADYSAYAAKKLARQDVSDNPINQSVFLAERYIDSTIDQFDERIIHKPAQAATFLLTFGDQVVAEQLWFSAYNQALRLGKHDPIEYADDLVARAVGGRGIGEVPLMQQSQFIKLIAPFQVEVNNAWQLMKQMGGNALKDKDKALGLLVMYSMTWIMNEINEALTGNRVGMDIFNAIEDAVKNWDPEKNLVANTFNSAWRLGGEILSNVPMGAQIAQMGVPDEYDREKLFGEADPSRYGTGNIGINAVFDPAIQYATGQNVDWQSLVTNFVTPIGGKQLNRMYKMAEDAGIIPRIDFNRDDKLLINGNAVGKDSEGNDVPFNEIKWEEFFKDTKSGSYNDKGGLKYPIDTSNPINMAKGFAFGTYATKEGKEYIKEGYSALSKQNTEKYEDLVKDSAKNYADAKTYYDYFRQKEDNSYSNAELLNQKAMQDAIKQMIEKGPTETDENGVVTSKYEYSDFGTTEKAMKAYAGAIAKGIDFNIVKEASKIKSVQKQDGERDSKAITHSAAALVRKFYEEKGVYRKIVDYCDHSKDTDVTAFGLAEKVLNDAYYEKVLSEIEKVRKGK